MSDDSEPHIKPILRAIARELARQQREGVPNLSNLSEATLEDLESAGRGAIDTDELTRRINQRLATQPHASVP